ncbi:MAG: alpha-galactosidase, partial [Bacteroidetes bacterium]
VDLHGSGSNPITMNILSPWYDYIKERIFTIVEENGIEYLKIDFAMVKSAYVMDVEHSGSHDSTAQYKGREEFLYLSYMKLMCFFDELGEAFPELIIDCTFELWGDWHIIDYALIKHADVDWISNFGAAPPQGSRDVRRLSWHHGLVVPSSCMMIGNQQMDAENHEFSFISNLGHTPIMLGDPRNLSVEEKAWYLKYYNWYRKMDEKFEVSKYYQTSDVFPEPKASNWDGFARFNGEKQGGMLCFFRNGSSEETRKFLIPWLISDREYVVKNVDGELVGEFSGAELLQDGFQVSIDSRHKAEVFSIASTIVINKP